ncbi:hypothetical protein Tco_0823745 [Tanacetum coccineum]|uniref:SPK domain-containing protein n=1 Tax=Tanacetum coccineum TaxID=301880 RepID=A0ABQ5AJR7_9ASTR
MLDTQQFAYTVDMFRDTLHLPVETPENPFVAPANINTIEVFMNKVGYQGVVNKVSAFYTKNLAQPWHTMFKKKESIQYHRFIKLIIVDLMKKFPNIPKRLEEDYHSIKDDVPLVSVYTKRNVLVRGMLISDALLTAEIRETSDFKEYEMVFMKESKKRKQTARESSSRRVIIKKKKPNTPSIPPPGDDRERDEMAKATILSLILHKTALDAEAKENIAKVQEILEQEEIDKLVDGDEDEDSYASAFADSVINNDDDDTGSMLEPESHKEHPEHVSDDDEMKSAKKNNEVVIEKEVVDMSGSQEITKEQKTPSTTTRQKKSFTAKIRRLPGSMASMCRRRGLIRSHIKTKFITREFFVEKIKEVIQHFNKDREVSLVDISGMVSKEFAAHGPKLIEELF